MKATNFPNTGTYVYCLKLVVDTQYAQDDDSKSYDVAVNLMQAHPNLRVIISSSAAISLVASSSKYSDIHARKPEYTQLLDESFIRIVTVDSLSIVNSITGLFQMKIAFSVFRSSGHAK